MTTDELIARARYSWCEPELIRPGKVQYEACPVDVLSALLDLLAADLDGHDRLPDEGSAEMNCLDAIEEALGQ